MVLAAVIVITVARMAMAHSVTVDIVVDGQGVLAPYLLPNGVPLAAPAELSYFDLADQIFSTIPGLGVVNRANGVDVGTRLGFDAPFPLSYWDGRAVRPATAALTVLAPDAVGQYEVSATSPPQRGLHWGVYSGDLFWEEHGFFFLEPVDAPSGLYGLWIELTSPDYPTSTPLMVPFLYDPLAELSESQIQLGVQQLLAEHQSVSERGDFDESGALDAADIDTLSRAIRAGTLSEALDLNQDQQLDQTDRQIWVEQLFGSFFGDANLDHEFNSSDFVVVLQAGEYEDLSPLNSTWSTGDWDGDGDFSTADLVFALRGNGYEQGPRSAVSPVPEPGGLGWIAIGVLTWRTRHRQRPALTEAGRARHARTESPSSRSRPSFTSALPMIPEKQRETENCRTPAGRPGPLAAPPTTNPDQHLDAAHVEEPTCLNDSTFFSSWALPAERRSLRWPAARPSSFAPFWPASMSWRGAPRHPRQGPAGGLSSR